MALYFDDKIWFRSSRWAGWSEGIDSFGWTRDSDTIGQLAAPPMEWFGASPKSEAKAVAEIALGIVQRIEGLPPEFRDWQGLAQSIYEETGVPLPPDLADSDSSPVSWPVAISEALLQTGLPAAHAERWGARVQQDLERLARIRVLPRYQLYPYQEPAVKAWVTRGRNGIVAMPTATGKTVIGIDAIRQGVQAGGRRFLVLVPSRLLANQWVSELRQKLFLRDLAPSTSDPHRSGSGLWVLTLQQAQRLGSALTNVKPFDLVIVDEVHRSLSKSESGFGATVARIPASAKLGLSATLPEDTATSALGPVVHSLGFRTAAQMGFIPEFTMTYTPCPVTEEDQREYEALSKELDVQRPEIEAFAGAQEEFVAGMQGEPWNVEDFLNWFRSQEREEERVRRYQGLEAQREQVLRDSRPKIEVAAAEIKTRLEDRVGFVMADRIDFANAIHGLLEGVPGYLAHSDLSDARRDEAIAFIRAAERRALLIAAKLADEGLDVPRASIAFNVSAPATMTSLVQRLGRILRQHPNKPQPIFHHFESVPEWRYGQPLAASALDSSVARFLLRAQDVAALGKHLDFRVPTDAPLDEGAFEAALARIGKGTSPSTDAALPLVAARMRRARRVHSRLASDVRAQVDSMRGATTLDLARTITQLSGDTAAEVFLREHGIYYSLAVEHSVEVTG